MHVFKKEEYQERIAKTKKKMEEWGIELLFVSQPANMNYLTGYDGWSFYVHQCLLVSLDKEEPVWIGRGMDANGARITSMLSDENIYQYADDYVHSLVKHPMHYMADIIKKHGWDKKVIGVEMDQFYFTHRAFVELEKSLPNATFKDANTLVNWVRVIKSDNEIEFMKIAGQIASNVMKTAQKHIAPGVRECDVAAEVAKAQYKGVGEYSGDYPAIVPLMMAGEATKTPHLTWSEKKYENDEAVLLELCGVYRHYHVPIARTLYLGEEPPKLMVDTGKTVLEGLDAALDMIKPGVIVEDIEATWRKTIEKTGLVKESRIGYSIGVNYPPDWGEQTISVRPGDKTVVQENMALHLIPGIWLDDVGFEVDASFYVTKDGVKQFFDDSREILVKK